MNRWWWPFSKFVFCDDTLNYNASDHTHACDEREGHGYQHICNCGFRWAA